MWGYCVKIYLNFKGSLTAWMFGLFENSNKSSVRIVTESRSISILFILDSLVFSREDTRLSSRFFTNGSSDHGDSNDGNQSVTSTITSRHSSVVLEGDVITRLTRTLPETLMIKANQNINKIIDKRKQRMLRKSRDCSSRDTMQDPRWQKLASALSDNFTAE